MGSLSSFHTGGSGSFLEDGPEGRGTSEDIMQRLTDAFAQMNIAAEFLMMSEEADGESPNAQLACLIKERVTTLQELATRLYQSLDKDGTPYCELEQ